MVKSQRHCEEWKGGWKTGEQRTHAYLRNLQSNLVSLSPMIYYFSQLPNLIYHHQLCHQHPWRSKYCAFKSVSLWLWKALNTELKKEPPMSGILLSQTLTTVPFGRFSILSKSSHPTNIYWAITMCQSQARNRDDTRLFPPAQFLA